MFDGRRREIETAKKKWQDRLTIIHQQSSSVTVEADVHFDKSYQEYYFELDDLISKLNEGIGQTMAGSEKRFLESYKGHMESVAKELTRFK